MRLLSACGFSTRNVALALAALSAWSMVRAQTPAPIAITVPPGFEVMRIGAAPLIKYPVMGNFDERGRLFVAENAGVNRTDKQLDEETPNHVTLLEDTDGDGVFDRSTLFADKMTFPQGALWHQGGLYVCSPPSIWRLEDTNGDGKADVRKELVTGFKYTGNAADVHGPFLHPNGRIYWCHGRKGHEVKQADGKVVAKGLAARIWSMRPDGSDVQFHGSGGMDNPAEVTFSQEGDVFGTVNIFLRGPRADAIVHWIHGAAYPHYEQATGELLRTGPLLGAAGLIGHVAPAGVALLRHEAWASEGRNTLLWAEFNTRRIMRTSLEPQGSTYRIAPEVFASTTNDGAHFTDVFEDADGSVIVFDTGAWFRQGCPTSGVARPDILGGIYRIRRSGTKPVADLRGQKIAWTITAPAKLVELLGDARPPVRDHAIAELASRGAAAIPALSAALQDQRHLVRSNAVWALTRIGNAGADAAARAALEDSDPRIRQVAAQSAFFTLDQEAIGTLTRLLADNSLAVRREAARALGRLRATSAIDSLAQMAATAGSDPVLTHAAIYALLEIGAVDATRNLMTASNPLARRAGLIVLDQLPGANLPAPTVFEALQSPEPALRNAALQIALKHDGWGLAAAQHLAWLFRYPSSPARDDVAGALLSKFLPSAEVREWLATNVKRVPAQITFAAIAGAPTAWDDRWREWLVTAVRSSDAALAQAALRAIATHRERDFGDVLREISRDTTRPTAFRVAALQTAAGADRTMDNVAFQMVLEPFLTGGSPESRLQAAGVIGQSKLTRPQLLKLAALLPSAGPLDLPQMLSTFQRGPADPEIGNVLLEKLTASPARFGLSSRDIQPVFVRYPDGQAKVAPLVAELLKQAAAKTTRVTELEKLVAKGDATRGRKAFTEGAGACMSCHFAAETGTKIGPDLSRIGRIREVRDLVESISFPDSSIAQGYEAFRVDTKAGETLVGTIPRETSEQVVLVTSDGRENVLARSNIARLEPVPNSLMPSGLDRALDPQTFADLVAFLKSLQ